MTKNSLKLSLTVILALSGSIQLHANTLSINATRAALITMMYHLSNPGNFGAELMEKKLKVGLSIGQRGGLPIRKETSAQGVGIPVTYFLNVASSAAAVEATLWGALVCSKLTEPIVGSKASVYISEFIKKFALYPELKKMIG